MLMNNTYLELPQFIYDKKQTHESNFQVWYDMNCWEKKGFDEDVYTTKEARKVFNSLYSKSLF